jgi:hypothetical protein
MRGEGADYCRQLTKNHRILAYLQSQIGYEYFSAGKYAEAKQYRFFLLLQFNDTDELYVTLWNFMFVHAHALLPLSCARQVLQRSDEARPARGVVVHTHVHVDVPPSLLAEAPQSPRIR